MSRTSTRPKCLRCGRALAAQYVYKDVREEKQQAISDPTTGAPIVDVSTRSVHEKLLGYGYAARGTFCSLTCGFWWANDRVKGGTF